MWANLNCYKFPLWPQLISTSPAVPVQGLSPKYTWDNSQPGLGSGTFGASHLPPAASCCGPTASTCPAVLAGLGTEGKEFTEGFF